jgi:hypothetical protein
MYAAVKGVLDALFVQFMGGTDGDELTLFRATLAAELPAAFSLGGLSWGESREPFDDGGYNFLAMGFNIHHTRTDY